MRAKRIEAGQVQGRYQVPLPSTEKARRTLGLLLPLMGFSSGLLLGASASIRLVSVKPTRSTPGLSNMIAGSVDGHAGPGSTFTPMSLVHASLEPGARLDLPGVVTAVVGLVALVYGLGSVVSRFASLISG